MLSPLLVESPLLVSPLDSVLSLCCSVSDPVSFPEDPPDSDVEADDASLVLSGELVVSLEPELPVLVERESGCVVSVLTVGVAPVVKSISTGVYAVCVGCNTSCWHVVSPLEATDAQT